MEFKLLHRGGAAASNLIRNQDVCDDAELISEAFTYWSASDQILIVKSLQSLIRTYSDLYLCSESLTNMIFFFHICNFIISTNSCTPPPPHKLFFVEFDYFQRKSQWAGWSNNTSSPAATADFAGPEEQLNVVRLTQHIYTLIVPARTGPGSAVSTCEKRFVTVSSSSFRWRTGSASLKSLTISAAFQTSSGSGIQTRVYWNRENNWVKLLSCTTAAGALILV